ncbi:MAG: hypothetical protein ABI721_04445 [Candidatus Dojkabacteria bacterium]
MKEYIPGVCNIGKDEIEYRRRSGFVGITISVVVAIILFLLGIPTIFRVIILFPLFASAIGILQAQFHFCAGFAMRGIFNFKSLGEKETIVQKEFRRKDQEKAAQIIFLSFLISVIFTILFLLV